jgi:hypothetical protein
MTRRLAVVLSCDDVRVRRVRYVFDTLFMAKGLAVAYVTEPPPDGPWLLYARPESWGSLEERCIAIPYIPHAWDFSSPLYARELSCTGDGRASLDAMHSGCSITFDLVACAFYFLSSWSERTERVEETRGLFRNSVYSELQIPQDIVDRYLELLMGALRTKCERISSARWLDPIWPGEAEYSIVLSHDIDFIPGGLIDSVKQAAKTMARHLIRERDPSDALRSGVGFLSAVVGGRDAYGCVPEIIEKEKRLGVKAAFQVAVGHRHPLDVNYRIEEEKVAAYLRTILNEDFELNLHGSYRSTEKLDWYIDEANVLARVLSKPLGSRQHFLSFHYDRLFTAQERSGIQYDMSMGYPDRTGPRAGFSYPYFPYCLSEDRPYNVLEISLFLMDVTLRSYLGLKGEEAWSVIEEELARVRRKRGCVSVVWHPIVFGGARDPGYDALFWKLVEYVQGTNGLPTDGRTINACWRARANEYSSFASL